MRLNLNFLKTILTCTLIISGTFIHSSNAAEVRPREISKLVALGELGDRVGRLIIENKDPVLSSVLLSALRHPRIKVLSLRELKHDWSNEFLAIAVVENRPFSKVHIMQVGQQQNYNDELTKRFLSKENLSHDYFWLVLPKTSNRKNVMTVAHELTHVFVQKFFDEQAPKLLRKYPGLIIGTKGTRFIIDSDVYSYLTEFFARVIEYAYFDQISDQLTQASQEFYDAPYLKKGDSFAQFRWKATQYLIREYKIPQAKARLWMESQITQDMIRYAILTGSLIK